MISPVDRADVLVDAHVHLWRLRDRPQPWIDPKSMAAINRDFELADLGRAIDGLGVGRVVLVQVLNREDETEDYLGLAARSPLVSGVVGWVDVAAPDVLDRVDRLRGRAPGAGLLGVRHQAQAEVDPAGWLARAEVRRGVRELGRAGLVFELMMAASQLGAARAFVESCPDSLLILDHAGKPPLAAGWESAACRSWAQEIASLAAYENLVCKLSGLITMATPGGWVDADLAAPVEHLLSTFGPDRLVFGTDWPNCLRAGSYRRTVEAVTVQLGTLSGSERSAVLGGNAARVYGFAGP
jgi:L-fuconolactonase